MNGVRKLAEIPAGSWTKWVVMGFWVLVLVVALPLSSKLMGAEKNDASAWLPASAESTKVLNAQARFQSPNVYTGVVVYQRASGLTPADRAKAAADARRFAGVPGVVPGHVVGPISSADGQAARNRPKTRSSRSGSRFSRRLNQFGPKVTITSLAGLEASRLTRRSGTLTFPQLSKIARIGWPHAPVISRSRSASVPASA